MSSKIVREHQTRLAALPTEIEKVRERTAFLDKVDRAFAALETMNHNIVSSNEWVEAYEDLLDELK